MVKIAKITTGEGKKIWIGYQRAEYNGQKGWRVCASNGDDIGYYKPQSKIKCCQDIEAMYGRGWDIEWLR